MFKNKEKAIKIALTIIIAILIGYFIFKSGVFEKYGVEEIKNYISSFGVFGPIIYIIMFSLVPLTLFPDAVLAVAGGVVFGVYMGTLYTIIGAICGGTISFYISRFLGRGVVEKLIRGKGQLFDDGIEDRGFLLILILRLIPLIPFDVISYCAGLTKIKYRDFVLATAIGIIPGVLIYSNIGDKAVDIKSPEFIIAMLLLVILALTSYILKRKISVKEIQDKIVKNQ